MSKKTNKTEHVLNLLTGHNSEVSNPLLNEEFKHEMIHTRNNDENLQKVPVAKKNIKVDILEELVKENIDSVIERFNICDCDECKKEITINTLRDTKPVYVDIVNNDYKEVNTQKEIYKNKVISKLVKSAIRIKTNPIHNK